MNPTWRSHPRLIGQFHPQYPDDIQVVIHEGGPRLSKSAPELVWVSVLTAESENVFSGRILNEPHNLHSLGQGKQIKFIAPEVGQHPVLVTDKYLKERLQWKIHGCDKCGLSELFDAPSDLIRVIFPNMPPDADLEAFTSFCGFCGGIQAIESLKGIPNE